MKRSVLVAVAWTVEDVPIQRLAAAAATSLGRNAEGLILGRTCPQCGSDAHGRPWMRNGEGALHVSVSRSEGFSALASSTVAPLGVDVERAAAPHLTGVDEVFLHPSERESGRTTDAILWTRKEAALKAWGVGLAVPPSSFAVSGSQEPPAVTLAPEGPYGDLRLVEVESDSRFALAVAVLTTQSVVVRSVRVERAADDRSTSR
jgi:4'-phosphopantetheinyl transferase